MPLGEIGSLLDRRASVGFVGRERERRLLGELSDPNGSTLLAQLHGIAGVGKSALLNVALSDARACGARVVRLDCRAIEPTERGFLHELNVELGGFRARVADVAALLGDAGRRVVLALDNYEVFRLMDTWLRQTFLPALTRNVRVLVAGREPPLPAWLASAEWQGLFRSVPLGPLDQRDALQVLAGCDVDPEAAQRINRIARGHPLALKLAASGVSERQDLGLEEAAMQRVVEELTRVFLADVEDPLTRRALEAASVVRRTTEPLLRAMVPDAVARDAFERLRALAFVEIGRDGLIVHDAVREAGASALRAADPGRYRQLRQAAWGELRAEMASAGTPELWRYTADTLYLLENRSVREAFFPSGAQLHVVEPARPSDASAIEAIYEAHEPPASARRLADWWNEAPAAFSVIRDRDELIVGFTVVFDPTEVNRGLLWSDPVTRQWAEHMRDHPVRGGERVLFVRRWLGLQDGEGPSPVQAAGWLDIKRTYLAQRPHLRRVYATVCDLATFAPIVARLRFRPLPGADVDLDGVTYSTAVLDMGPSSVDGWLADLLAEELGLADDISVDLDAGELRLHGRQLALAPLELGVVGHLHLREGKVVSRRELLQEVWGHDHGGGSNLVDSVVRSLRKKLGADAACIETVRGYGYRFRRS